MHRLARAHRSTSTRSNTVSFPCPRSLGAMTLKVGAAGTLYFDQFEARRVLPIGPYVP